MIDGAVCIDGEVVPAREARVSVFDRSFLYGDSVFEVMRAYAGHVFRQSEHLARLRASCERVLIPLPGDERTLASQVERTIAASGLHDCYLRVMVCRGGTPVTLQIEPTAAASVLVFALPLREPPAEHYERGVAAGLYHAVPPGAGTRAAGAKTSNYLVSMLALHDVRQRGCQEALLVNGLGEVVEGASSNLFVVRDGTLLTPPSASGILLGITRRVVLELADALGLGWREALLYPSDLYRAHEVFITSSVREVVPVVRVDDVGVGDGRPGSVTRRLHAAYGAEVSRSRRA